MNNAISRLVPAVCLVLCGVATACAGQVSLSAAASMREVVNALADSFAEQHPGVKFLKNYGGSGALAKQIENGAPADIFISDNQEWMDSLQGKGMMDSASIDTFAYNELVVVGLQGWQVSSLQQLASLRKIAIGSPESVPAGQYAMEALTRAGLVQKFTGKLVMAKDVRDCLLYATRKEVDAAFVYRTDALLTRKVKILFAVPKDLYSRVHYAMGLTRTGAENRDAEAFCRYLKSDLAKRVLTIYGFALK